LKISKKAFHLRRVEIAMKSVPKTVKDIKQKAFTEVFAKELNELDGESKEVLDKVVSYLEKKYISVPMKMAKEILIANQQ
jgi:glutamyl-tRNA reductase